MFFVCGALRARPLDPAMFSHAWQAFLLAQQGFEGLDFPAVTDAFWVNFKQIDVSEVRHRTGGDRGIGGWLLPQT